MPTTNNNQPVDMKQLWQQMEPAVTVSSALAAFTTSEDGSDRFIYYIVGALFYRYDTYGNTWQKLAPPLVTPTVFASLRYSKYGGTHSKVISAPSSTSLRIAPINAQYLVGKTIRITHGTGAGQVRTIITSPEPTKYEQGLATTASATQLGDSTKKWKFNQWVGYQARITFGTGATQIRRILYNDTTTLTFSDTNYQPIDPWNNQGFATAPVTTAGSQAHFVIEATDITVAAWTTNPDYSSRFKIESGGVWLFTSAAAAPFASIQYYDVAGDYWLTKTVPTSFVLAAFATDGTIERTGEIGGIYQTGTASAGSDYSLTDASKTFVDSAYVNYRIRITGGTGVGQSRRIIASSTTVIEVGRKWDINPSTDSIYEIIADNDKIYLGGNAQSMLLQYDIDSDLILQGSKYDDGIANILAARFTGTEQQPIAITSGTRTTTSMTAVATAPTAGGTLYSLGDILTCNATGSNGKVIVTSVDAGGVVLGVALMRGGSGYSSGTGKSTTGGTGTLCTINITATGTTCLVATAMNHNFKIGDQVILSGDALYAGTVTITGVDSFTAFDFATSAAGNMTAANALSATVTVDSTKNWAVNEHVGKIIQTHLVGVTGAVQPRVITGNTATTITTTTITTALVNGTGRYVIVSPSALGRDEQRRDPTQSAEGKATGGGLTSLIDNNKNWIPNSWIGYKVRVEAGTGRDITMTVTSNTSSTLNYSSAGFTPDATTYYRIQDTYGTCTGAGSTSTLVDATKLWATNQWAGKRVRITGGAGFALTAATNEITIASNTTTTLTFTAITAFAPDATTTYTILGTPVRGAGSELVWLFGGTSAGKYLIYPRGGGANTVDRYNIPTEKYEYGLLFSPQTDTMTTGSYYAYDGVNRLYYSPGVATGVVQYVYYYNMVDNRTYGLGSVPNTQLAPVIGNRMEIVTSPAGIDYLYHMRNTGAEIYRAQIYF
jgi:hypothetical protein